MIRSFLEQKVVMKSVQFKTIYNDNKASSYIKTVDYIDIICGEPIMLV